MNKIPDEYEIIFRPYITLKNGTVLWARQVGKKAFPIKVKKESRLTYIIQKNYFG